MNNKLKKHIIIMLSLAFLMLFINIAYFALNRGKVLNDTCVSVLRTQEFTSNFISNETATLVINPDLSGYISFSGKISLHNQVMTLFREIRFHYEQENDGIYKLYDIKTVKHPLDNASDDLVDKVFFSTSPENTRYMTVNKVKNAYIIGNLHSPVFMCVVK